MTKQKDEKENSEKSHNNKPKKSGYFWIIIALILITIGLAIFLGMSATKKINKTPLDNGNIAATLNGEVISLDELNQRYDKLPLQYKSVVTKENMLQQLISERLLLQEAKQQDVQVSDDEIQEIIQALIEKNKITKEEFIDNLGKQNMTYEDFIELYKNQLIINKLINISVTSKIKISDEEIREFYDKNKELFSAKEGQIRARHILLKDENTAKDILNQINKGADFIMLARKNSTDLGSAQLGGDLGFFGPGQMVKEFEEAAFKLKIGEISDIVKTNFGYHIIKRESQIIDFDEAGDGVELILQNQKQEKLIKDFILDLKSKADIKIMLTNETQKKAEEDSDVVNIKPGSTFKDNGNEICYKDNKPIIRLFTAKDCPHCIWIKTTFDEVAKEFIQKDQIIAYHWELDNGDNLLSEEIEKFIPNDELELFKKFSPKSSVPTFVFGCKYLRIGNAFEKEKNLNKEKEEFIAVINELLYE